MAYECQRNVEDMALAGWDPEWLPAITAPIIYEEERVLKAIQGYIEREMCDGIGDTESEDDQRSLAQDEDLIDED